MVSLFRPSAGAMWPSRRRASGDGGASLPEAQSSSYELAKEPSTYPGDYAFWFPASRVVRSHEGFDADGGPRSA